MKRELKWWANALFFRRYRYRRTERRHLLGDYSPAAPLPTVQERTFVMMNDGKRLHGGLADRLRAIVSLYSLCRNNDIRFKINFTFPFQLADYLAPNLYDWTLKEGELSYNSKSSHPFFTDTIGFNDERERRWERRYVVQQILGSGYRQLHVYSPFDFVDRKFGTLFHELFKPSPALEAALTPHRDALKGGYISVSTRFMELLGDFHEPKAKCVLDETEHTALIHSCLEQIKRLQTKNPGKTVLVTSDSQRFLTACKALSGVYIVEGTIAHSDTADTSDHLKTFLDFWLISEADAVYQLRTGGMYAGNFSLKAAKAADKPHHLIEF